MRSKYPACARMINNCYITESTFRCVTAAAYCNKELIGPYQQSGQNPYDVRKKCTGGKLCYAILEALQRYLNLPQVKKEVGAEVERYQSCNTQINMRFNLAGDWMKPYHRLVTHLLEDGVRVLV